MEGGGPPNPRLARVGFPDPRWSRWQPTGAAKGLRTCTPDGRMHNSRFGDGGRALPPGRRFAPWVQVWCVPSHAAPVSSEIPA